MKLNFKLKFLNQMRLGQKFLLLGAVALTLVAYPLYTSVKTDLEAIDNVRTEQGGLPAIQQVQELLQALQDHRTAGSYFVQNDLTRAAPRGKAAADVDERLAQLEKLAAPTGDVVLTRRVAEVKQEWALLKAEVDSRKLQEREVVGKHTALIGKALLMIQDWTAYAQIDLDPDAAAYYSFRAALIDLPALKESIRALRSPVGDRLEELAKARALAGQQGQATAGEAAMRDAWRAEDRTRFLDTIQQAEASSRSYADNMRKAMASSASIKAEMGDQVAQIAQLTDQAAQYARRELLAKDFPSVDATAFTREVSVSRALAIKASEQTDKVLASALGAREAKAKRDVYFVLGSSAALLALGMVIALFTVRNITGTVADLQTSVEKVRQGDFQALEQIESKDEVGDLGRTVNNLLQERMAAQKKAEDENEVLNNSVISILQSVHQLSQRDLTARAPVTQDIIGTVSDSINALTDETAKVLNGVSRIAGQVATASGKVQTQAALVSKTAEDDRANVGQMIESLATATQTMNQVATLTEQTNVSATQATQATDSALETVNGTVKGMESIRETIAETEKRIKRLGERSQEISGIVNLINTISERTHVLALNASMQAAVAGEAGRGFAVVAEEVQRLAESSRNATQQIGTLVSNIQLETNETIATVNRTIGQVVQGSQQAQKAGDQMRVTQQITAQLVAQVQRIALASDEQKTMSAQLLKSVQKIGASSERTAEQITSQNVETESLLQSARRLVESVNVFKLPLAA